MHDDCLKKDCWGAQEEKNKRYDDHIKASDDPGGYRDRVGDLERSMQLVPYICAVCAFCGGLLGKAAPDALNYFVGLFR